MLWTTLTRDPKGKWMCEVICAYPHPELREALERRGDPKDTIYNSVYCQRKGGFHLQKSLWIQSAYKIRI